MSISSRSHDICRRRSRCCRRCRLSDSPSRRDGLEVSSSSRIVRRNHQSSSSIRILRRCGSRTMSTRDSSSCCRRTIRSSRRVVRLVVDDDSISSVRRGGSGDLAEIASELLHSLARVYAERLPLMRIEILLDDLFTSSSLKENESTHPRRRTTPSLKIGSSECWHSSQTQMRQSRKMLQQVVNRLNGDVLAVRQMNPFQ